MNDPLTPPQRALAEYMSSISEKAYYAGWMDGLEYALWEAVLGLRKEYGRTTFAAEHTEALKRLSAGCAGWIVFDDEREETWISTAEWNKRYTEWRKNSNLKPSDG